LGGLVKPVYVMNESKMESGLSFEDEVKADKQLRKDADEIIQRVKDLPSSRERSLAITKLQEGVMWLGMDLKRLGEQNPYPNSKDPNTGTKIEPTADGLKL
jgi:hypothetical protein